MKKSANITIGKKIELARRERGWSQEVLEKRTSINRVTISDYERGKISNIGLGNLRKIADATGKPLSFFMPDQSFDIRGDFGSELQYIKSLPKRAIPVFDTSCGKIIDWTDGSYPIKHYPETEPTDSSDINAFYVRAHGDSMTGRADDKRTIFDGDLLLVEPNRNVEDGDIVFCRIDDKGVIVKKFKKEKNKIRLIPLNDKYQITDLDVKNQFRVFPIMEIKRKLRK